MTFNECNLCYAICKIDRHHVTYFPEYTIPVCRTCHKIIHKGRGLEGYRPPKNHARLFYKGHRFRNAEEANAYLKRFEKKPVTKSRRDIELEMNLQKLVRGG